MREPPEWCLSLLAGGEGLRALPLEMRKTNLRGRHGHAGADVRPDFASGRPPQLAISSPLEAAK
ncbi:hypothetical protein IVA98_22665 [Bradyrhizobium sp. 160]|uniref:hypothetical protein n=1 Tax=unclassified Bradyrhizobium TaxID=2631580 RepID=UPI001FFBB036|nr:MULTISPECIES: hypothetical protein [unclassified Bradyrhizobium]MCK1542372.1 hypothetical protein [Bradyrhizobium sp. 179]MCK1625917.1 hypothetical protein [Bradyrhizobium sp. 160]